MHGHGAGSVMEATAAVLRGGAPEAPDTSILNELSDAQKAALAALVTDPSA